MSDIEITDNSDAVKEAFEAAIMRGLEKCGLTAEGYAKRLCPVDNGTLRNSITHQVDDHDVLIGSNLEYAPYVELGTGKYYPGGQADALGIPGRARQLALHPR